MMRSVRRKLGALLAFTTFLALAMAGIALLAIDLRTRITSAEADLTVQADIVGLASGAALAFDDRRVAAENLRVLRAKPNVVAAALYGAAGEVFASYDASGEAAPPSRPPAAGIELGWTYLRVVRPVTTGSERIGWVFVQERHELLSRVLEYMGVLVVVLATSLASALLVSHRLQSLITTPLGAIGDVARRVKEGRFELRAKRTSDDEIGELADAFNAMLDELARRARTREDAIEALRSSDERYQLAVRGSSAGLWDWDMRAGTMAYAPRLRALLGYELAEFPDEPGSLARIVHDEDSERVDEALRAHLDRDLPYVVEARLRCRSGEWRWFQMTGMARKDDAGHPVRMVGSIVDVTERKVAERVLQESNRAKDEFIATLAHELRNPLAPIRTGLEILQQDRSNGPASARARETMARQLGHMVRLIDDLLDISRINSGKIHLERVWTRLGSAIDSAIEISRPAIESRGHTLVVEPPAADIELVVDGTRIAQALGNLLNNAAKYTPPGGHIRLRWWREAGHALVEVKDNGVGIPGDMLETVFQLFAQAGRTLDRAQGGLGIGLYLVRSLVEMHGGSVTAASAGPNLGSTFTVRLPCPETAVQAEPPTNEPAPAAERAPLRILVVDDNVDAAETLCTVLDLTGRETRAVHDGHSVADAVAAFTPDVVLLDIGLPGTSGYEVARKLRADPRHASLHIVAVTGWGSEQDRRRSSDAGFDAHLTKPVDLDSLEALLRRLSGAPA